MIRKRWLGMVAVAGVLLLGAARQADAKPVLQEDFNGPVAGLKGRGAVVGGGAYQGPGGEEDKVGSWVEYDLTTLPFNPVEGTIELDLTRGEKDRHETLFSFQDAAGERVAWCFIDWSGLDGNKNKPILTLRGPGGVNYWLTPAKDEYGNAMPIPRAVLHAVPQGATLHFAVTWGPAGIVLYLDGQKLPGVANESALFASRLSAAVKLLVGGMTSAKRIPNGAWSMSASLIDNLQLHDRQLAATELAQPIVPDAAAITEVTHDGSAVAGFSGKLVAGNTLTATLTGTPGGAASFDIARLPDSLNSITLDWKGFGVYLEDKAFFEPGEVNLRDADEYLVYLGKEPLAVVPPDQVAAAVEQGAALVSHAGVTYRLDGEPLETIDDIRVQTFKADFLDSGVPYYATVVARMDDGSLVPVIMPLQGIAMAQAPDAPGTYTGSCTLGYGDRIADAVLVGRLAVGTARAALASDEELKIDTALRVNVTASPNELKADEKGTSRVTVTVTDANGDEVGNHQMRFLLATTSQYTGVVGGGQFTDQVGGSLGEGFEGTTDLFGQVSLTYQAGFAAKTAIIVARDMVSNDTGAGYIKTYITATAELELEPVEPVAAAELGYAIEVTSSDEWLTADGKSQAKITARVTLNDEPVEGHQITFAVTSGVGTIRAVDSATDADGKAHAVYTAGKKIGIVLITATDTTINLSGTVQIELRSDAPAKIKIQINPQKLPADGHSSADLLVTITDINDNPNEGVGMEYAILGGSGRITKVDELTDKNGEAEATFVAGKTAGKVTIEVTVRSTVPTEAEMASARDMAQEVTDYDIY